MNFTDTRIYKALTEEPFHKVAQKVLRLAEEGRDVNFVGDNGQTYLHVVAEFADKFREPRAVPVAYQLCVAGIDVNHRDQEGNTCLHNVVRKEGVYRIVVALLRCGCDPLVKDATGRTAEDILTQDRPCGWEETLYWLQKFYTGLPNTLRADHVDAIRVKELLSSWCRLFVTVDGSTVSLIDEYKSSANPDPALVTEMERHVASNELAVATLTGSVKWIKAALNDIHADVNTSDKSYRYHYSHSPEVAQPLIAAAWEQDNYDVIDLLMSLRPTTSNLYSNHNGRTKKPLVFHVLSGRPRPDNIRVVHRILRGSDLSKRNHKGQTVLYEAIDQKLHINVFKEILTYGVDIAARDVKGRTARDYANKLGYTEYVQAIDRCVIQAVEDRDIETIEGWVLRGYDHVEDVIKDELLTNERLKEKIEDNRLYKETAKCIENLFRLERLCRLLMDAVDRRDLESINKHAKGHHTLCQNTCGHTLLHRAIMTRDQDCMFELLMSHHHLMDIADNFQRTSLHYAFLFFGSAHQVTHMMTKLGAQCDTLDINGRVPEDYNREALTSHQYNSLIKEVTEYEAYIYLRQMDFDSGIKRAIKEGDQSRVSDLLHQAGTRVRMAEHSQLVFYCIDQDQPDIAAFLLQNGCDPDIWKQYEKCDSTSTLCEMSKCQHPVVSLHERSKQKGFNELADYIEDMRQLKLESDQQPKTSGPLQVMANFGVLANA